MTASAIPDNLPSASVLARQVGCSYSTAYHRLALVRRGERGPEHLYATPANTGRGFGLHVGRHATPTARADDMPSRCPVTGGLVTPA